MNYLDYINRNKSAISQVSSDETKAVMLQHIQWAVELASRLNGMDYDQRDASIQRIKSVMEADYKAAGLDVEEDLERTAEIPKI